MPGQQSQSKLKHTSSARREPCYKESPDHRRRYCRIQTALDIADAGYEVDIVEKTPSIGGRMSQLDKTFPTLDCSACILTPKMVEAAAHEKINIYTYSEVEHVSGFVGDFTVDIRKKARSVNMDKCTGCGVCQENVRPRRFRTNLTED